MIKPTLKRAGHLREIAGMHIKFELVQAGVPQGEVGIIGLQFQSGKRQAGHATGEAQPGGAATAAEIEHGLPGAGIYGGGEQDRICGGPVPPQRLPQTQAAPQKIIKGQITVGKHLKARGDVVVGEDGPRDEQIAVGNHQAARQYAKGAVKDAHVDVQLKHGYILALKHGFGKGDDGWVGTAQKFLHGDR